MSSRRGALLFALFAVAFVSLLWAAALLVRHSVPGKGSDVVLVLDTPYELEEDVPPARGFPFVGGALRTRVTVWDLVHGLDQASRDDHVHGLVLHVDDVDWGWAKVAEVRDALARFRAAGKPVWASMTGGGEREYLLATAAQRISMPPTARLQIDGLMASVMFFRGAFDKFGVSPNFAQVGRYKSAVETFTRTGFSPDARAAAESVLDDLYQSLVDSLAVARRMRPDVVRAAIDGGPWEADEALARGLIDTLMYDSDVDSLAVHLHGRHPALSFGRYLDRMDEPGAGPRVALVTAVGEIGPGKSRDIPGQGPSIGAETLVEALREARTRRSIKAVVLRIDSPGGDAQASDDIWHEVERCRRVKPVIVSMSDYAASGGYYMAVPADSIVAQPATITGSIGIFGGKLNILGLLQKVGVNVETVSRGRHAGMLSPYKDFSPEEAARYQRSLEHFYAGFVARVARGRHMAEADVDSVGQGRVWTGVAAQPRRLVDALGGYPRAFAMARARAHIDPDEEIVVERLPHVPRDWFTRVVDLLSDEDDRADALPPGLPPVVTAWIAAARFPAGHALALLPWSIEVR